MNCLRATSSGLRYRPCFVTHQRRTFLFRKKGKEASTKPADAAGVVDRYFERNFGKSAAWFLSKTMIGRMVRRALIMMVVKAAVVATIASFLMMCSFFIFVHQVLTVIGYLDGPYDFNLLLVSGLMMMPGIMSGIMYGQLLL
eukprot:TRINITY_DN329_c0_g1_i2.p1 TRINITY_DN329_c0_g1~~TRINITY_DN329_c0_g1_i2.p1  ORF type:complete len:142 (+),score=14.56 TRINITY_DN329_c0_g1_i2:55-480(+)